MTIMIAEDNRASAKILEISLRNDGYASFIARNGKEALECLQSMPDIELVITDIMMPEMDGLELLRTMKEHAEWKEIPVIMFTALADLETVKKAAGMGCREYLTKPIIPAQLIQKVRKALGDKRVMVQSK
jgi:CheY-like chemotaxis protein